MGLGRLVDDKGLSISEDRLEAILRMPPHTNKDLLASWYHTMGSWSYCIPDFALIMAPISDLSKKDAVFEWGNRQQDAYELIRDEIAKGGVFIEPLSDDRLEMYCDACDSVGVGGGLFARRERKLFEAWFWSTKYSSAQYGYHIADKEALAIVYCLHKSWRILKRSRHPLTICTDHEALVKLLTQDTSNFDNLVWVRKMARYAQVLRDFDFEF